MSVEHVWDDGKAFGYQVCRKCCVVKRRDGKNKPCRPARLRDMELGLLDEDGHITPVDTSVLNELMMKPLTDMGEQDIVHTDHSLAPCPECGKVIQWERTHNGVALVWHVVHCGWGHQR